MCFAFFAHLIRDCFSGKKKSSGGFWCVDTNPVRFYEVKTRCQDETREPLLAAPSLGGKKQQQRSYEYNLTLWPLSLPESHHKNLKLPEGKQMPDDRQGNQSSNYDNNYQSSNIKMAQGEPECDIERVAKLKEEEEAAASKFRIRTANRRHLDFGPAEGSTIEQSAHQWSGPFHFIQAADSQFGMIDSFVHKRIEPGWQEEIKLCRELVAKCAIMEPKPLFMVICGDLVDSRPPNELRLRQVVDFKRIFAQLDQLQIPLVCVCGNHDVGDEPTPESVLDFRKTFGDDYYYFTTNGVLFIVINSQFYQHRDYVLDYAQQQDTWLEGLLAKCKLFKYSIVFEHIPWFLEHPEEEDDYFNIKKEVRLKWLQKFQEAGVTKIMCGHYHRNAGGWYKNMELVVTSAIGAQCGNDKSGARIVRVLDNSIQHQYYAVEDIPSKIELRSSSSGAGGGAAVGAGASLFVAQTEAFQNQLSNVLSGVERSLAVTCESIMGKMRQLEEKIQDMENRCSDLAKDAEKAIREANSDKP